MEGELFEGVPLVNRVGIHGASRCCTREKEREAEGEDEFSDQSIKTIELVGKLL